MITVKDETFGGKVLRELDLDLSSTELSLQELITARVNAEVERFNQQSTQLFQGLVEPTDAEKTLNGYLLKSKRAIDAEKQVYIALQAFQSNGYFVLIDNLQAESLEQRFSISPDTHISFIQLTPLVGG